ncbi:MAG: GIY-YIG nuclease family protein [Desulfovibrio sp.]|uniref:GIY-YIG nuclease family protein n=1 Tax=Desulfovibrio sp. TaxID=885 RepID=UPI001A774871|nr:GIY-YIG nuclease family protein [Desulfovibrio sp.]MBD5418248.1 GIY-YIG nuclease family protein [Desulfovibrio sp.]
MKASATLKGSLWYVYLLECRDGTLYCGITCDLERRVAQHNGLLAGGARYTRGRRPVRLTASLVCADKPTALRLERAVKARPRAKKRLFFCVESASVERAPC